MNDCKKEIEREIERSKNTINSCKELNEFINDLINSSLSFYAKSNAEVCLKTLKKQLLKNMDKIKKAHYNDSHLKMALFMQSLDILMNYIAVQHDKNQENIIALQGELKRFKSDKPSPNAEELGLGHLDLEEQLDLLLNGPQGNSH